MKAYTYESNSLVEGICFEGEDFPYICLADGNSIKNVFLDALNVYPSDGWLSAFDLVKYKYEDKSIHVVIREQSASATIIVRVQGEGVVSYTDQQFIEGVMSKNGSGEYVVDVLFKLEPKQFIEISHFKTGKKITLINDGKLLKKMPSTVFNKFGKFYYLGEKIED